MAGRNSSVKFNAFEQALSDDIDRLQRIASRELQNVLRDGSRADEARNTVTGLFAGPGTPPANVGQPINGARRLPQLEPFGALNMLLSVGEAFLEDASIGGDDSDYQVVRWEAALLAFAGGAGSPRIDLVVATPSMVGTDSIARNILVDPATRTVQSQIVPKTENPKATIAIVAGTPGATPLPPPIPAGALVLFEVYVPAGAAVATAFSVVRRVARRVEFPLSSYNGVLQGCVPLWGGTLDESASAGVLIGGPGTPVHRAVIDGELLVGGTGAIGVYQDSAANPFSGANPTTDAPYYIYLCGGRNSPQFDYTNLAAPFIGVESTTPPDAFGHASADLSVASLRGTIPRSATLYVGLGFRIKSTAFRKGCLVRGDWIHSLSGANTVPPGRSAAFNEVAVGPIAVATNVGLGSRVRAGVAIPSTAAKLLVTSGTTYAIYSLRTGAAVSPIVAAFASLDVGQFEIPLLGLGGAGNEEIEVTPSGATTVYVAASAYNMNVPRLSP